MSERRYSAIVHAVYVRRSGDEDNGEIESVWASEVDAEREAARLMFSHSSNVIEAYAVPYHVIAPSEPS